MSSSNLYDRRFILFTGKGGVGKTTVASAFAYSCARRGEKTLLIELNTRDRLSSMFGSERVGTEIMEVEENLYAVNSTPEAAMEEYAMMMLKVRIVYKAVFENRIVQSFLRAIPGLNELVMLGKAYFHAVEMQDGRHVWDKVVVDAPATGHGIFFLQIPDVITSILSSGHMYEEARAIQKVLRDPEITALNLVTLPEEMPVNETMMLFETARTKLEVPLGYVIANGIYPEVFDPADLETVAAAEPELEGTTFHGLFAAAKFRGVRHALQRRYLDELHESLPLPMLKLPFVFSEKIDFVAIKHMAQTLREQLEPAEMP